jgi:branched-chain amino acid transport system substrate-binding protein
MMKEKKIDRRTFIKGVGAAGLTVSTFGFPSVGRSANLSEVVIACVQPLSGVQGATGNNAIRGWNIAVDEINASGGIKSLGGAKIKTEFGDTQSTPRVGMAEIEKIARNKNVPVGVGCYQSAVTFPATQVAEQYGLPFIVDVSTQPEILRRGFKYVFRLGIPSDKMNEQSVDFVEAIGKKTGHFAKRAALLSLDDNYGRSSAEDYRNALKKKSKQEIVEEIYYPTKATNVDVEIAKLKAAKPDVVYLSGFVTDAVLIVKALSSQKVNLMGSINGGGGYVDPKFLEMVGPLANYLCAAAQWNYDMDKPMEAEFNNKMRTRYGVDANHHSAILYSCVYVIKDALERAGTIDRDQVREAIKNTSITSGRALTIPAKFIKFDDRGENIGFDILIAQCLEGKYHTVWPPEFKPKHSPVWPIPKWEDR